MVEAQVRMNKKACSNIDECLELESLKMDEYCFSSDEVFMLFGLVNLH